MGCCEHKIYERKKNAALMQILCERIATLSLEKQVIVERLHGIYGKYYEILSAEEAAITEEPVLYEFEYVSTESVQPGLADGVTE